jgi:FkbH-like protein
LDTPAIAAELGEAKAVDRRFWFHYEAPFSPALLERVAEAVVVALGRRLGVVKKVIVLDCDNTLWGGVVGEDGLEGIKLSPSEPSGRPYHAFQRQLASLKQRGVLLCLCSKNNLADVHEVFDAHPYSVLKAGDFVAERVTWNDKAKNLRELAKELQLGLDSFVFIDDSDVECSLVRAELPDVEVLQVPRVVSDLPGLLQRCLAFGAEGVTKEDALRAQSYVDDKRRELERARHTDIVGFLQSLEIVLEIRPGSRATLARLVQLAARTNQFNLTTVRYSDAELASLLDSPDHIVLELDARDRFGVQGLTGLCVVSLTCGRLSIDAFMLSCRVLGRKIEQGFLSRAISLARARFGQRPVRGRFIATPKNEQTRDFFKEAGFSMLESEHGQVEVAPVDISFELAADAEVAFPSHLLLEAQHDRASGASGFGGAGSTEHLGWRKDLRPGFGGVGLSSAHEPDCRH